MDEHLSVLRPGDAAATLPEPFPTTTDLAHEADMLKRLEEIAVLATRAAATDRPGVWSGTLTRIAELAR